MCEFVRIAEAHIPNPALIPLDIPYLYHLPLKAGNALMMPMVSRVSMEGGNSLSSGDTYFRKNMLGTLHNICLIVVSVQPITALATFGSSRNMTVSRSKRSLRISSLMTIVQRVLRLYVVQNWITICGIGQIIIRLLLYYIYYFSLKDLLHIHQYICTLSVLVKEYIYF